MRAITPEAYRQRFGHDLPEGYTLADRLRDLIRAYPNVKRPSKVVWEMGTDTTTTLRRHLAKLDSN